MAAMMKALKKEKILVEDWRAANEEEGVSESTIETVIDVSRKGLRGGEGRGGGRRRPRGS